MAAVDLVTVAQVRAELELPMSDTTRDSLIATMITQASRAIMSNTQREFVCEDDQSVDVSRVLSMPVTSYLLDLNPWDLYSTDGATVKLHAGEPEEETIASADRSFEPIGPRWTYLSLRFSNEIDIHNSNFTRRFGHTKVEISSTKWGFASVPEDVQRACIITVASNLDRRVDAFGFNMELAEPDQGLQPNRATTFTIPTAALSLLAPYRRHPGVF